MRVAGQQDAEEFAEVGFMSDECDGRPVAGLLQFAQYLGVVAAGREAGECAHLALEVR